MSTNYYFRNKNSIEIKDILNGVISDVFIEKIDNEINNLELHIGKRSAGWKPLFEKTEYYSSIKEIVSFYKKNKKFIKIEDEYGKELTLYDLYKELFIWNKHNEKALSHKGNNDINIDDLGYEFSLSRFC